MTVPRPGKICLHSTKNVCPICGFYPETVTDNLLKNCKNFSRCRQGHYWFKCKYGEIHSGHVKNTFQKTRCDCGKRFTLQPNRDKHLKCLFCGFKNNLSNYSQCQRCKKNLFSTYPKRLFLVEDI